ncbi:hypothetical protein [Streptomyces hainanensis]|uniref:Uncharacterized protein n=1 Tax=Streptomyces hainanensis TaxID=402648 RepID=A0A4R4TP97_9ACTN|nr:hypothetical protein [Streptomyces hainanensis]TDC79720.1 hypothetical protein E1283_02235 [Streptomyces hainanensis]
MTRIMDRSSGDEERGGPGEGAHVRDVLEIVVGSGAEPPLGDLTDAAVAGGRRVRRRRGAALLAGVATALLVAVSATAALRQAEPGPVGPARPTQSPTSVEPTPRPAGPVVPPTDEVVPSSNPQEPQDVTNGSR